MARFSKRDPELPIVTVADRPIPTELLRVAAAGATELLKWDAEATAAEAGAQLSEAVASPFVQEFLGALERTLPDRCRLCLARCLSEVQRGAVPDEALLARAGGWNLEALRAAFESCGLGSFEDWVERARVYAVVHRAATGTEAELVGEARRMRFSGYREFEEACRHWVGEEPRRLVSPGASQAVPGRIVEQALAKRERSRRRRSLEPSVSCPLPDPSDHGWITTDALDAALRYARSLVGSDDDAEDVVQDAVMAIERRRQKRLAEQRERGGGDRPIRFKRGYLMAAVKNTARDLGRKRSRTAPTVRLEDVDLPSSGPLPDVPPGDPNVRKAVRGALKGVPAEQALATLLIRGHGWPVSDVAALVDRSPAAVRGLLHRAAATLAPALEALWEKRKMR